ncbi:uncharacterized protein LOC114929787 [Nylanderia fulva]|uniref:uncharacterized protein LOC114929787 n=1 Tax=Nylanderia fulva TaxID=613905 RepID=UPI0010FB6899|nr:uncharacterized protein LOC114929787 [Nylanderia fulva]
MKIYIRLCLFAVFFTDINSKPTDQHLISEINYTVAKDGQENFQTDLISKDLEIIKLEVKQTIRKVESVIQQTKHVRVETEEDTLNTVTERWWEQMDRYGDYVNLLLASMRREVNAAKAKNKDAQHCYDTNFCGISQHSDTAYKAANKCKDLAETSIKKSLKFIDNLVSFGESLIQELKEVVVNCFDNDDTKMYSCILNELGRINDVVKRFEEDAKYIEFNTALPTSNYVVLQASKCLNNVYQLARSESEGAMLSNSRCVKNVVANKKTLIDSKLTPKCKLQLISL